MLFKKLKISFYTCCLSIILMIVPINAIDVLIGGESVGIILNYDGVCITGFYKIKLTMKLLIHLIILKLMILLPVLIRKMLKQLMI